MYGFACTQSSAPLLALVISVLLIREPITYIKEAAYPPIFNYRILTHLPNTRVSKCHEHTNVCPRKVLLTLRKNSDLHV